MFNNSLKAHRWLPFPFCPQVLTAFALMKLEYVGQWLFLDPLNHWPTPSEWFELPYWSSGGSSIALLNCSRKFDMPLLEFSLITKLPSHPQCTNVINTNPITVGWQVKRKKNLEELHLKSHQSAIWTSARRVPEVQ